MLRNNQPKWKDELVDNRPDEGWPDYERWPDDPPEIDSSTRMWGAVFLFVAVVLFVIFGAMLYAALKAVNGL